MVDVKWWVFPRGAAKDRRFIFSWAPSAAEPNARKQRTLPAHLRTQTAAEKYARGHLVDLTAARAPRASSKAPTLAVVAARFIPLRRADTRMSRSTVRNNVSHIEHHIIPDLGTVHVDELDEPKLRAWVRKKRGEVAAYTCRNIVSTLAEVLDAVTGEGWWLLPGNPARAKSVRKELPTGRPVAGRSQTLRLTTEQAQALVDGAAVPLEWRVRYVVALTSGLRDGELAGLTWADVDLDAALPVMHVRRALQLDGPDGFATIGDTKTDDSVRPMPLHPAAVAALKAWRAGGWEQFAGRLPTAASPVLPGDGGGFCRPRSADRIREHLDATGGPTAIGGFPLTFHAVRRSFASFLAEARVPGEVISRLLGHVPKSVADRHYTQADLAELASHVVKIPLTWGSSCATPSDPAGSLPQSATEPMRDDASALVLSTNPRFVPSSAHGAEHFLNRRPVVRFDPGALTQVGDGTPLSGAPPSDSCAGFRHVRTRVAHEKGPTGTFAAAAGLISLHTSGVPYAALELHEAAGRPFTGDPEFCRSAHATLGGAS